MMKTIIAIAGAVQLTRCIMALIEALELSLIHISEPTRP